VLCGDFVRTQDSKACFKRANTGAFVDVSLGFSHISPNKRARRSATPSPIQRTPRGFVIRREADFFHYHAQRFVDERIPVLRASNAAFSVAISTLETTANAARF
jgi:hypothetical protein